jgi:hypothetical protein
VLSIAIRVIVPLTTIARNVPILMESNMTTEQEIESKIAAMELLMQRGYISLAKFLEFIKRVKK